MTICRDLEWDGEEVAVVIPSKATVLHPVLTAVYSSLSALKIKVLTFSEMLVIRGLEL